MRFACAVPIGNVVQCEMRPPDTFDSATCGVLVQEGGRYKGNGTVGVGASRLLPSVLG
jgi:hypothetical protein